MRIVTEILERVTVGPAQTHANLTLFPLLGASGRQPDYATLDEAIQGGWLEVGEVSTGTQAGPASTRCRLPSRRRSLPRFNGAAPRTGSGFSSSRPWTTSTP